MERFEVVAPRKAEMMVAPFARHRQVQLIPASPLEAPAIVLHRPLEQVDGVGGVGEIVLVNHGHVDSKPQNEAAEPQTGTRFCGGTRVWDSSSPPREKIPQL